MGAESGEGGGLMCLGNAAMLLAAHQNARLDSARRRAYEAAARASVLKEAQEDSNIIDAEYEVLTPQLALPSPRRQA